ncbi:MAG: DNA-binding response regulator [Oscillospiraceae bacterium]|jgi:two-component system response regulator YesN|nr:DNA-binding response regulator [Oscillospiraceae bacterium]
MLKIVVVEDEELVRRGIVLAVDWAALDCAIVGEATNGEDGITEVERYNPDIIITDIKMPKMDGLEMVRQLRERGNTANIIILTAYSSFAYAQSAIKLGAVDYLLKPFHDSDLEQAIKRIVSNKSEDTAEYEPSSCVRKVSQTAKSKYVMQALNFIAQNYGDPEITAGSIANSLNISNSHLNHIFKKETAYTISAYITNYRLHAAMQMLHDCRNRVYEVTERVGYRDIAYFSSTFKKAVGMSPSEYQRSCQ